MMPGVRAPQPPTTGLPPNCSRRRRHSLPALSSSQLSNISSSLPRTNAGKDFSKSSPDDATVTKQSTSKRQKKFGVEKPGSTQNIESRGLVNGKNRKTTEMPQNTNHNVTRNSPVTSPLSNFELTRYSSGSSSLQGKIQSDKSNAIFIFKFDDNENDTTTTRTTDIAKPDKPAVRCNDVASPVLDIIPFVTETQLTDTSLQNTADAFKSSSSDCSVSSPKSNTKVFSGKKHKKYRMIGKLVTTMSPVQELKTPTDDSEFCSVDDLSSDSSTEYTDTSSPSLSRANEKITNFRREPPKLNANSNLLFKRASDVANVSERLKLTLSVSHPNPNSNMLHKDALNAMKIGTSRSRQERPSPPMSPSRFRRMMRRGSLDTAVSNIFSNLNPSSSRVLSTSSSTSSAIPVLSTDVKMDPKDTWPDGSHFATPPPARLLSRRRSVSALPFEPINMQGADLSRQRRRSITELSRNPAMSMHAAAAAAIATRQAAKQSVDDNDNYPMWDDIKKTRYLRGPHVSDACSSEEIEYKTR